MLTRLYWINAALLSTHEVDSAYWREWNLFHLPGGLPGFLLLHVALFLLVFWGFDEVVRGRRRGLWFSLILAAFGIFATTVHGVFLLRGGADFRIPASILLLIAIGAVSVAQAVAALRAFAGNTGIKTA
jgi:thiol:disulfide interchange protein